MVKCYCPHCNLTVIPERTHDELTGEDLIICPKCQAELSQDDVDLDYGLDEITKEEELEMPYLICPHCGARLPEPNQFSSEDANEGVFKETQNENT